MDLKALRERMMKDISAVTDSEEALDLVDVMADLFALSVVRSGSIELRKHKGHDCPIQLVLTSYIYNKLGQVEDSIHRNMHLNAKTQGLPWESANSDIYEGLLAVLKEKMKTMQAGDKEEIIIYDPREETKGTRH